MVRCKLMVRVLKCRKWDGTEFTKHGRIPCGRIYRMTRIFILCIATMPSLRMRSIPSDLLITVSRFLVPSQEIISLRHNSTRKRVHKLACNYIKTLYTGSPDLAHAP